MTKNRRQKKNEQQTCSAMEIIAGFLLRTPDMGDN